MCAKCVIIFVFVIVVVRCAKILVFSPTPSHNHQLVFNMIVRALIERKHEVTAINIEPVYPQGETVDNLTEISLKNMTVTSWAKKSKILFSNQSNLLKMEEVYRELTEVFIEQVKEEEVQNLIRDKSLKFDLLILPNAVPATLIFTHIFKAPVIYLSTFGALPGNMKMIGTETHPLLYPTHYQEKMYNLTLLEKIYELHTYKEYTDVHEKQELNADQLLKSVFGFETKLQELKNNIQMLFLNIHPIWIHNQPLPPSVFYIWGIHKRTGKKLPEDLQTYLDSSERGAIYVSFGSLFKTSKMTPEIRDILLKVFSRLPYNILWKWDTDELPGKSENIKISKWFPQSDILRHPNLKLFITHAGLGSTAEAIDAGVPLIGIPQFSDQAYNAEKYSYFKIGEKLSYNSLSVENLENALNSIFADYESYKRNIIQLRTYMDDHPMPVLEQVTRRIEHVLRHNDAKHLKSPAANMSWTDYYELELVLLILTVLLSILSVLLLTVSKFLRYCCCLMNFKMKRPKTMRYKS